ncbi:hypothetical protein CYR55_08485 [Chimaeribacter californicus]|uniref:Uncharacterized protein n=1 Tax=Chimaeribacter californicus TaxID=2060067 RepID=A0A2N5EA34_9GAMM|nr:hypothetical protein [Chimaeribacter californicus]PLR38769.1 hypothetical protein CYR55_08485 [Chimaeribacter californicus]
MNKICLTAAGLLALALSASSLAAVAAPAEKAPDAPPSMMEGKGPHGNFPGKMPPPPMIPLYQASLQTDNPTEGLNKLLSVMPQKSGGHYEVRVSVVELPPAPPAPAAH